MLYEVITPPFPFMCIPDVGGLGSWVWVGQEGKDRDSPFWGGSAVTHL